MPKRTKQPSKPVDRSLRPAVQPSIDVESILALVVQWKKMQQASLKHFHNTFADDIYTPGENFAAACTFYQCRKELLEIIGQPIEHWK